MCFFFLTESSTGVVQYYVTSDNVLTGPFLPRENFTKILLLNLILMFLKCQAVFLVRLYAGVGLLAAIMVLVITVKWGADPSPRGSKSSFQFYVLQAILSIQTTLSVGPAPA